MINCHLTVNVSFDLCALYKIDLHWLITWGDAGMNQAHASETQWGIWAKQGGTEAAFTRRKKFRWGNIGQTWQDCLPYIVNRAGHQNEVYSDTTWNKIFYIVQWMWQCQFTPSSPYIAREVGKEQHGDFFLLTLRTIETARDWEKRARDFLHLGNIIQIPQCWIFDDAGKEKGVRRGDRVRENGVRGKIWGGKPGEGAVLSEGRCSPDCTPQKCLEWEGAKKVRNLMVCALLCSNLVYIMM